MWISRNFSEHFFYRTSLDDYFRGVSSWSVIAHGLNVKVFKINVWMISIFEVVNIDRMKEIFVLRITVFLLTFVYKLINWKSNFWKCLTILKCWKEFALPAKQLFRVCYKTWKNFKCDFIQRSLFCWVDLSGCKYVFQLFFTC